MEQITCVIKDENGIHARPAGLLVKEASKFKCKITIECKEKCGDAKKIFSLMSMGIKSGDSVIVRAYGEDEHEAIQTIGNFIKNNL